MDLIFDLDGTISDPLEGIAKSVNYSLEALSQPPRPIEELAGYIGPHLDVIFRALIPNCDDETINQAIVKYRERYRKIGYQENELYPEIIATLDTLRDSGHRLHICTAKREDVAVSVIEYFGIRDRFSSINGCDIGREKDELLALMLASDIVSPVACMIGDRAIDILAGAANEMITIGVTYGYGSREELTGAKADVIVDHHDEIASRISQLGAHKPAF